MRIRTPTDLGATIRDHRRRLGLDQETLADRVGVSRQWIIAVEKGKPRAEIGLVLRTLQALDLRLSVDPPGDDSSDAKRPINIDDVVENATKRKPRR